jgi:endonuclease-8
MPEGDTIHYAANRIRPILEGPCPHEAAGRRTRATTATAGPRLAGRACASVRRARQHLFLRFEGNLTIHSHLRMTGSWGTGLGSAGAAARRAWLVPARGDGEVVQFDGPCSTDDGVAARASTVDHPARSGHHQARTSDAERFLRRLREDDPTRRSATRCSTSARSPGIGNLWKVEGCCLPRHRPVAAHRRGVRRGGAAHRSRDPPVDAGVGHPRDAGPPTETIYGKTDRPCPRCGGRCACAASGTTTARPSGARGARREAHRPQGRPTSSPPATRSRASRRRSRPPST